MPSFFTSTSPQKSPKQNTTVFAGLDDPFNFPSYKMRYNSRSRSRTSSPDSAHDSGYCSSLSPDEDSPLSPKSQVLPKNRRKLEKRNGHWRMNSYEYQSQDNDREAEHEPILQQTGRGAADDGHGQRPDPKRTFTGIQNKTKPKWYTSRVYGKALERKEKSEGVTDLQRSMAPVIRRPSPSPSKSMIAKGVRPPAGSRKKSTLLHPSPPPPASTLTSITSTTVTCRETSPVRRGRKPSTLLHPSPPPTQGVEHTPMLRSPRHRSPTPLGIPVSSERQPTPTPLRIHLRKPSVLHSCFSDSDSASGGETEDGNVGAGDDVWSVESAGGAARDKNGAILAQTALVARAVRVRVESPGLKKGADAWFV
jgi:hypothetical protein